MAGSSWATPTSNSRIANSSISWQAACNTDVTGWSKSSEFVVALWAQCGDHGGCTSVFIVQWRNLTDGGSWTTLASGTGELRQGTGTSLVNGNTVATSSGCNSSTDSEEVEGDNTTSSLTVTAKDQYVEVQCAFDPANALDSKEYEFRLYDNTAGAGLTEGTASLTTEAGATTYYQDVGEYSLGPTGTLKKKTSLPRMGNFSLGPTGTLKKKSILPRMGGYSLGPTGTLATVKTALVNVGNYSMAITGTLKRKISLPRMGNHSMTITGHAKKKMFQVVGEYSMTITGTVAAVKKFFKNVGEYSMAITGTLSTKALYKKVVGEYSLSIVGTLKKKISLPRMGGHSMTITGAIRKKINKLVGGYSMAITGTLGKTLRILQTVGNASLSITGTLVTQFIAAGSKIINKIFKYYYH